MVLLAISFIAGVLTVLAPCVLPLLPVIVGGSLAGGSRRRAYTICISLGLSIIAFTLLLKATTVLLGVPQWVWQWVSGGILLAFGLTMLFPRLWDAMPFVGSLNRGSNALLAVGYKKDSLAGDALMGAALGPVFASCSPTYFVILATVLPASFLMGLADLLAYALGLSGFLLLIALTGQKLVDRLNITIEPGGWFRRSIGALFILVGILVATGTMTRAEIWLLDRGLFDITGIEQKLLGAPEGASSPQEAAGMLSAEAKELMYRKAPELVQPDGYINTEGKPITLAELRGKVVLLDIWTYSCINCQRTFPYLKDWYAKYKEQGFEIIGVHTPEFAFEKVKANVEKAAKEFGLTYPIVQDNQYQTWNALGNQYWPRKYLIDIDGYIIYDHIGEGAYAETEMAIQKALAERDARLGLSAATMPDVPVSPGAVSADGNKPRSPETYFGAARNEYLGSGTRGKTGVQYFAESESVLPNTLYLVGSWNIMPEYALTAEDVGSPSIGSGRIDYRYRAKSVYFVAGSANGTSIEVEVLRDSKPLEQGFAGADVHFEGGRSYITVSGNRLYKVIEDPEYGDHFLEFIISKPGLQAYTFTFG